jgi:hypothetical protein
LKNIEEATSIQVIFSGCFTAFYTFSVPHSWDRCNIQGHGNLKNILNGIRDEYE